MPFWSVIAPEGNVQLAPGGRLPQLRLTAPLKKLGPGGEVAPLIDIRYSAICPAVTVCLFDTVKFRFKPKSVKPVPLRLNVCGLPVASSVKLICPVLVPAAVGTKVAPATKAGAVWFGWMTAGRVGLPLALKSEPVTVILVNVIGAVPVLTMQIGEGVLRPTCNAPTSMVELGAITV